MAKELTGTALSLNGVRITEIKQTADGSSQSALVTEYGLDNRLDAIILSGSNPGEIYNVKSYGAVANAVVPASGNTVTGTNNATAFNTAIAAAPSNATVLVPAGNWLCSTPLTAITTKRLNIVVLGNVYTNGANFLTFSGPGGADRQHTVIILGSIIGRVNMPTHSKSAYDAGTGPDWASFTGAAITINQNVNSMHVQANIIEGFESGILMTQGGGNGSQENTFAIQKLYKNRYGIHLRSTDGLSWCDKNIFTGFDGGHCRITGDIALYVDGYSGAAATNGEQYNGAFRSNEFYFLAEAVNQVIVANADMTEPKFDITIEGGVNTGVFGTPAIQCRIVSPNYIRSPKWCGQGVLGVGWLTSGLGIDGTINMPVWNGGTYIGNTGIIDTSGNIIMNVRRSLTLASRTALASNIKTANLTTEARNTVTTTAAAYTVLTDDYQVLCNRASGACVVNLPTASSNVGRELIVRNINAVGTVSHSNGDPTATTTIAAGDGGIVWYCDGTNWRVKSRWHD